jgi:hypothetical protein
VKPGHEPSFDRSQRDATVWRNPKKNAEVSTDNDERRRAMPLGVRRAVAGSVLLLAAAITLGPMPVRALDLATEVAQALAARLCSDVSPGRPRRAEVEAGLNILVPATIVLLVHWSYPQINRFKVIAVGVGMSLVTEAAQFVLPGRRSDPQDVLLNSLGVLVAALAAWLIAHVWSRTVEDP